MRFTVCFGKYNSLIVYNLQKEEVIDLTRFNKIAVQAIAQMAADKEAVGLSRVNMYKSKCILIIVYSVFKTLLTLLECTQS